MGRQARDKAIRVNRRNARRSAQETVTAPSVRNTQMSLAQITIDHMRRQGTLYTLTGDGELDEQDLEAEWQHKLETSPNWQEKMEKMTNHQKKNFLRHKHDAFIEGMRKAFACAQAKMDDGRLAPADDGGKIALPSRGARPGEEGGQETDASTGSHQDRLQEPDGLQPVPSQGNSKVSRTASKQGFSQKEQEVLALAMLHRDRMHRENPDEPKAVSTYELSQAEDEAQVLARIKQERKKQYESSEEYLLHKASLHKESLYKEACRRKREKRKGELKAFDASRNKFNANQKEFKSKKEAFKASKKEAREQKREALEAEKEAKANGPLQEELAQQRREAKKKRKRAALEANPKAKDEREQRGFGFRYFSTEKARARAQKELSDIEVSQATRRQGLTCHFTDE
jgi:hypothetical protein